MQAIVETLFDAVYLISVIGIGVLMIRGSKGECQFCLFGWMAVVLGPSVVWSFLKRQEKGEHVRNVWVLAEMMVSPFRGRCQA